MRMIVLELHLPPSRRESIENSTDREFQVLPPTDHLLSIKSAEEVRGALLLKPRPELTGRSHSR